MKTVTYDYAVIIDDEIIPAFTPIEVEEDVKETLTTEQPKEEVVENAHSNDEVVGKNEDSVEKVVEKNATTEQPEEKAVKKNDAKRGRKS